MQNRLSQRSTLIGIASILSVIAGLFTGTIGIDVAVPLLGNGAGLIFADA